MRHVITSLVHVLFNLAFLVLATEFRGSRLLEQVALPNTVFGEGYPCQHTSKVQLPLPYRWLTTADQSHILTAALA